MKSLLYMKVADQLREQIQSSLLRPGDKLPSVRFLSESMKVSVSTVLQAYSHLETSGLIEARPQSGYYVTEWLNLSKLSLVKSADSAEPVATNDALLDVLEACGNPRLVPLGAALIDPGLLPISALRKALSAVARNSKSDFFNYGPANGAIEFREAIAKRSLLHGKAVDPEDIITTTGCMEALLLATMAVTKPGDIVAIESPAYHGTVNMLEQLNLKVIEIASDEGEGLRLDDLEKACGRYAIRALIVTPNFNNPLGSQMNDSAKVRLLDLANKYLFYLIEDDAYGDLSFTNQRGKTLKSLDKKDRVLFCSSFSKTLGPGFRSGWIVPTLDTYDSILKLKFATTVSASTASHLAVAEYINSKSYDRHLRRLRPFLMANVHMYTKKILECFPKGTKVSQPRGGFLLWVELPEGRDALKIHISALRAGISLVPGPLFSASGKFQNYLRINCGNPWHEGISRAIEKIGEM